MYVSGKSDVYQVQQNQVSDSRCTATFARAKALVVGVTLVSGPDEAVSSCGQHHDRHANKSRSQRDVADHVAATLRPVFVIEDKCIDQDPCGPPDADHAVRLPCGWGEVVKIQRRAWITVLALVAAFPLALFIRAVVADSFSDSGLWIGVVLLVAFGAILTTVVAALFFPALYLASRSGRTRTRPLALIGAGVVLAHLVAAFGMASSNWWLFTYPVIAALAAAAIWVSSRSERTVL